MEPHLVHPQCGAGATGVPGGHEGLQERKGSRERRGGMWGEGGPGGQAALPGGAAPSWGRWGRGGEAERAATAASPAVPSGETELGVGRRGRQGLGAGGITQCTTQMWGPRPPPAAHTHTHTLQPQQFPHSSRPPSPPSPQGTWKKPGGMGPPAMPSLGGRLPITGLGAAAALCGGRRAEQRVGSSPPRQGAALCPPAALGAAVGAPPSRPPSTHGAPSPTSQPPHASPPPRPQPRPGLWGQRASDRAARGEPGRCPPVGCSGAGGGLGGSVGLQGGLQGGPAPLACQPRSGGSC